MTLFIGVIFASILALLSYLPFGFLVIRIRKRSLNSNNTKSKQQKDAIIALILTVVGIYLAIQVFKLVMGNFISSLNG